jgi:ethanolamine utilization microcompartment shell protein EutS
MSKPEMSPLIQQATVLIPATAEETKPSKPNSRASGATTAMAEPQSFALGLIETQGFTAVFEAIDTACKAANVEVLGKEKLGGGYITIVIRGDVAAVKAAIDAGKSKVEGLGKLIAAHVIPRPSAAVLSLLPKL